jgi:hypothetical protein
MTGKIRRQDRMHRELVRWAQVPTESSDQRKAALLEEGSFVVA